MTEDYHYIIAYKRRDFNTSDKWIKLPVGDYTRDTAPWSKSGFAKNDLSSVKVGPYTRAELYGWKNFGGKLLIIENNTKNEFGIARLANVSSDKDYSVIPLTPSTYIDKGKLDNNFNNRISSIKVKKLEPPKAEEEEISGQKPAQDTSDTSGSADTTQPTQDTTPSGNMLTQQEEAELERQRAEEQKYYHELAQQQADLATQQDNEPHPYTTDAPVQDTSGVPTQDTSGDPAPDSTYAPTQDPTSYSTVQQQASPQTEQTVGNTLIWIIVICVCLIIIGGGAFFFFSR